MKMKEIFTDESKWIRGEFAKTKNGIPTTPYSEDAECFCIIGALRHCYSREPEDVFFTAFNKIEKYIENYIQEHRDRITKVLDDNNSVLGVIFTINDKVFTFEDVKTMCETLDI